MLASMPLLACAPNTDDWKPPHIILISVDTLRADRLATYGYPRDTAPHIDGAAIMSAPAPMDFVHR